MNTLRKYALVACMLTTALSCSKDKETIDDEKPTIDLSAATAFPKQCSQVKRGSSFTFQAKLADNVALGSYSVSVHHNFDHHSHSTEVQECTLDAIKKPINPFVVVRSVDIPGQPQQYEAQLQIEVPTDVDLGNYHFMIQVTDQSGWSIQKGISIRVVD